MSAKVTSKQAQLIFASSVKRKEECRYIRCENGTIEVNGVRWRASSKVGGRPVDFGASFRRKSPFGWLEEDDGFEEPEACPAWPFWAITMGRKPDCELMIGRLGDR
jgi:hypothetical protein